MPRPWHVVLAALLIGACGGSGDGAGGAGSSTSATATAATAATATLPPVPPVTITIEGFSFGDPQQVPVGTEVTVVNADTVTHTWTSQDGVFDSGQLAPGEQYTFTFTEARDYVFVCSIHAAMTGLISITG